MTLEVLETLEPTLEADKAPKTRKRTQNPKNDTGYSESAQNDKAPKTRRSNKDLQRIRDGLNQYVSLIGAGLSFTPSEKLRTDGEIILRGGPQLVDAVVALCEEDAKVRAMFLSLMTAGAYAQIVSAVMMIVLPILANHGVLPSIFLTATQNGAD